MNNEKQIEELARAFCGLSAHVKCSECSYECYQKLYARKAIEAGYRKASDVAEEIFLAIDETINLICAMTGLDIAIFGKYAELKKKYTEGDRNDGN